MRAATPARAAAKMEPWMLAADPVKVVVVGVEVAAGMLFTKSAGDHRRDSSLTTYVAL
jgi:hypothetical protein